MERTRPGRPSAGLVIAIVALVAALGGVAAAGPIRKALTRTKVVAIADQEIVKSAPGLSVSHAETAGKATSADRAGSAGNADHASQADNASTLDDLSANELVSFSASDSGEGCNPSSATFVTCESVNLFMSVGSDAVLIGNVGWYSVSSPTSGVCRLTMDGTQISGSDVTLPGETVDVTDSTHQGGAGLNTSVFAPAGSHNFTLECSQTQGDINFPGTWLTVIRTST
jgi:hypothetical protein